MARRTRRAGEDREARRDAGPHGVRRGARAPTLGLARRGVPLDEVDRRRRRAVRRRPACSARGAPPSCGLPLVALLFLLLTGGLLIVDLKRPDRFHYLLLRANPRSWLVLGAWILLAFGGVLGAWLLAAVGGAATRARDPGPSASCSSRWRRRGTARSSSARRRAGTSGRARWCCRTSWPGASAAGAAAAPPGDAAVRDRADACCWWALGVNVLLVLAECYTSHGNADARVAARAITRGRLRLVFWVGVDGGRLRAAGAARDPGLRRDQRPGRRRWPSSASISGKIAGCGRDRSPRSAEG